MRKSIAPPAPPRRTPKPATLTKREFMQQYVLNRAAALDGALSGNGAAVEAEGAWETIEKACAE